MSDPFQQVETEFFKLRGQFATGHISAEEFDAALQELQVRDAKGRVWMLGANTGQWYHTPDPEWIAADPTQAAETSASDELPIFENGAQLDDELEQPRDVRSAIEPITLNDPRDVTISRKVRVWTMIGIGVALLLIAATLFGSFDLYQFTFVPADDAPTPTRIVPRAAANSAANPPATRATRAEAESDAFLPTPIPSTATPALVIEPTSTAPALTIIPTITPNPNKQKAADENSALPPAVYVTNLRVAPNPPGRNALVTFTASFWNTNRESVPMNWRIILLDPNRGGRKDYGESPFVGITIPPGRTEFSITYTPVNSGGPCVTLQALAARRRDDNSRDVLRGTNGSPFAANFTFC